MTDDAHAAGSACPPPPPRPIDLLLSPVLVFARHKLAGGLLLLGAAVVALVWANSPWQHAYHALLEARAGVSLGGLALEKTLHHWINDGLMGVFFFLVGLEIKREIVAGELSSLRRAALPAIAAVGGIAVPAASYALLNAGTPGAAGWGIPTATDIAFALGVLALLGDRVPVGLKVFLTALAIVDDIGAVLIIAVFYTDDIAALSLALGFAVFLFSVLLNRLRVRNPVVFAALAVLCWLMFLESGVHATIAALIMSFTVPSSTRIDGQEVVRRMEALGERIRALAPWERARPATREQQAVLDAVAETLDHAGAPLQRIEHQLTAPVSFVVLPIFALANAGLTIEGSVVDALAHPVALGVVLGLFLGKQIGILSFAWLAVRLRLADLPDGVGWAQVHGVGVLGGVGFTMSLFVTGLAFADPALADASRTGILAASLLSGLVGFLLVRRASSARPPPEP